MKTKTGFVMPASLKKIALSYGTHAELYHDGVMIIERRRVKVDKNNYTEVVVEHLIPCELRFHVSRMERGPEEWKHAPSPHVAYIMAPAASLVDGLTEVYIDIDSASQNSRAHNIYVTDYHYTTQSGATHRTSVLCDYIGGDWEAVFTDYTLHSYGATYDKTSIKDCAMHIGAIRINYGKE